MPYYFARYIYCLTFISLVCNKYGSNTTHGKGRTLRFKITVRSVMGPCNLIGGYRGFGQDILPPPLMACEQRSSMLLQNICNHAPDYSVLTQTALQILTTVSTSKPVPKDIQNNWSVVGNVTLGKHSYRRSECLWKSSVFLDTGFNIILFSHQLYIQYFIFYHSNKLRTWNIKYFLIADVSINSHFKDRTIHDKFQGSTKITS